MRILYRGFEDWLNDVRKQIKVGDDSSRTYHLVIAMWRAEETEDNKTKKDGKAVPSNNSDESTNESDDDDDNEGCMSDSGLRLLSKKWSKEEMERNKRSKENDRDVRASSPMRGARSPSKKAMASPSPKAAASGPKEGKRSPNIEATASPSPKVAASSPKGGREVQLKRQRQVHLKVLWEGTTRGRRQQLVLLQVVSKGRNGGVLVLLEAVDQNLKLQRRRSRSRNDFKLS